MKPITRQQWNKMTPRQRSWLVCHAVTKDRVRVFWHLITSPEEIFEKPNTQIGGSYDSGDLDSWAATSLAPNGRDFSTFEFGEPACETIAEACALIALISLGLIHDRSPGKGNSSPSANSAPPRETPSPLGPRPSV